MSSTLTFLKSLLPVLLWWAAYLCLSATIFTLDKPTTDTYPLFRGVPCLTPACAGLLEQRVQTWTAKIYIQCWKFHMQVVLVYLKPFRRNSFLKCVSQTEIAKNSLKLPILGVQGHSRSTTLTFLRSSSPVLVMISSMSLPICSHFHFRRANGGRITPFKGSVPLLPPRSWGPTSPSSMKLCHEILQTIKRWKPEVSISPGLGTVPGRDGQTELP